MFYARFILAKKGKLGQVWLAAHLERKLSREFVFETKFEEAVNLIKTPDIKISLRTNGHLMLGIVRIYAKKAYFVLQDLDAAWRAFRHTDFSDRRARHPHRRRTRVAGGGLTAAPGGAIVEEAEEEDELDDEVPNMSDFDQPHGPEFRAFADPNQITLQEHDRPVDDATLSYLNDGFEPEALEGAEIDNAIEEAVDEFRRAESVASGRSRVNEPMEIDGLQPLNATAVEDARTSLGGVAMSQLNISTRDLSIPQLSADFGELIDMPPEVLAGLEPEVEIRPPPQDSGIHLEPLSESQIRQEIESERRPRRRRPRNLIVDDEICLEDAEIRDWMRNEPENRIDLAPPTRGAMTAKEKGTLLNIFNNPGTDLFINPNLMKLYQDRCVPNLRSADHEHPAAEDIRACLGMTIDHPEDPADEIQHSRPRSVADPPFLAQLGPHDLEEPRDAHDASVFNVMDSRAPSYAGTENYEVDVENQDPCAPPPFKRPRSTPDTTKTSILSHEVETAKKTLLNGLKGESAKRKNSKVDFDSTIMPGISNLSSLSVHTRQKLSFKAASSFYALLELQKDRAVQLSQSEPFGPIGVTVKS